jgi:hypothetical protein
MLIIVILDGKMHRRDDDGKMDFGEVRGVGMLTGFIYLGVGYSAGLLLTRDSQRAGSFLACCAPIGYSRGTLFHGINCA